MDSEKRASMNKTGNTVQRLVHNPEFYERKQLVPNLLSVSYIPLCPAARNPSHTINQSNT
jgi:hypothetical protein